MFYEPAKRNHGLPHDPFKAIVVPRPIGWISSLDRAGNANLAPYSFFNALSAYPHIVGFASEGRKDSLNNIEATGEFVCNLATYDLREAMNASSAPLPPGVSEFDAAGIATAPCRLVKPPRVAAAPAALECRYLRTIPMTGLDGGEATYLLVLGEVVGIHVDDAFIKDGKVDSSAMVAIGRGGYFDYWASGPQAAFSITRPKGAGTGT